MEYKKLRGAAGSFQTLDINKLKFTAFGSNVCHLYDRCKFNCY